MGGKGNIKHEKFTPQNGPNSKYGQTYVFLKDFEQTHHAHFFPHKNLKNNNYFFEIIKILFGIENLYIWPKICKIDRFLPFLSIFEVLNSLLGPLDL